MEKIFNIGRCSFLILVMACGGSDEPSLTEKQKVEALLTSVTWRVQEVKIDGVVQTTSFTGLTLKFTASTFTTTNGAVVWPSRGTWSFIDETAKKINRSDGVEFTILNASESTLSIRFSWNKTTLGEGRLASVEGEHEFTFTR